MTDLFGMQPQRPTPPPPGPPVHPPAFVGSAKADGTGAATIRLPVVPAGQVWALGVVIISANSTAVPTLAMWDRDPNAAGATFLEGSTAGNGDIDDAGVLVLFPNDQLTLVWAGATPNSICRCRVQYHIEAAG
jgi:hypothetical protein